MCTEFWTGKQEEMISWELRRLWKYSTKTDLESAGENVRTGFKYSRISVNSYFLCE